MIDTIHLKTYNFEVLKDNKLIIHERYNTKGKRVSKYQFSDVDNNQYFGTGNYASEVFLVQIVFDKKKVSPVLTIHTNVPSVIISRNTKCLSRNIIQSFAMELELALEDIGIKCSSKDLKITRLDLFIDLKCKKSILDYVKILINKKIDSRLPLMERRFNTTLYWKNKQHELSIYDKTEKMRQTVTVFDRAIVKKQNYQDVGLNRALAWQLIKQDYVKLRKDGIHLIRVERKLRTARKIEQVFKSSNFNQIFNDNKIDTVKQMFEEWVYKNLFDENEYTIECYKNQMIWDRFEDVYNTARTSKPPKRNSIFKLIAYFYVKDVIKPNMTKEELKLKILAFFPGKENDKLRENLRENLLDNYIDVEYETENFDEFNYRKKLNDELRNEVIKAFEKI